MMAGATHVRRARTRLGAAPPARAFAGEAVAELPDTGGGSAGPKPENADIFKAVTELGKKLSTVAKNQKVLEKRLDHLEKLIVNSGANVVSGAMFVEQAVWAVGWWASGDVDQSERMWPKTPHWR